MKITFFVHDLASNPIVRAYPLAKALLECGYEVEVLGFLISGSEVYSPYKGLLEYQTIQGSGHFHHAILKGPQLAAFATGDIIYACKPLWTSFWPALIASSFGKRKHLLLDIEDDELWFDFRGTPHFVMTHLIRGWNFAGALKYKTLLHPLTKLAINKTVVSRKLQKRYGGKIVLHGPNETLFNPERSDLSQKVCRQSLSLPQNTPFVLFAGTPHLHKGLRIIVGALRKPQAVPYHLVLAGPTEHPEFQSARHILGERCHLLGKLDNRLMPSLLTAVDVVPTPQQRNGFTEAQIPAKLLEAMAMQKAIVASRVSDLAEILGEGELQPRGWVIPPDDEEALANALCEILSNPNEAKRRGIAARQYFLENASTTAIASKLESILAGTTL